MFNQDFKEFIQFLNNNHVHYLVVGGYAVAVHGHPRYALGTSTKIILFRSLTRE
ncbi:MAG: hypothetical protein WBM32_04060 [Crocosphaera sp.]